MTSIKTSSALNITLCGAVLFLSTFYHEPLPQLKIRLESFFHTTPDNLNIIDFFFAFTSFLTQILFIEHCCQFHPLLWMAACMLGASISVLMLYFASTLAHLITCMGLCGAFLGPLWPLCALAVTKTSSKPGCNGIVMGMLGSSLICGASVSQWFFSYFTDMHAASFDWKHYFGLASIPIMVMVVSIAFQHVCCTSLGSGTCRPVYNMSPSLRSVVMATFMLFSLRFIQMIVFHTFPVYLTKVRKISLTESGQVINWFRAGGIFGLLMLGWTMDNCEYLSSIRSHFVFALIIGIAQLFFIFSLKNVVLLKASIFILGNIVHGSELYYTIFYLYDSYGWCVGGLKGVSFANGVSNVAMSVLVYFTHADRTYNLEFLA